MILYRKKVSGKEERELRFQWLADCFEDYAGECQRQSLREDFLGSISKNPYGKPVSKLVHFNISHSRDYWCVLFSDLPCGLDIQYKETRNYEKVVSRFFSESEKRLVDRDGEEMFYRIWARKESYVKFLGCGFREGYSHCDMAEEQGLLQEKSGGFFQEIEGPEGYVIAVCSESREPVVTKEFGYEKV